MNHVLRGLPRDLRVLVWEELDVIDKQVLKLILVDGYKIPKHLQWNVRKSIIEDEFSHLLGSLYDGGHLKWSEYCSWVVANQGKQNLLGYIIKHKKLPINISWIVFSAWRHRQGKILECLATVVDKDKIKKRIHDFRSIVVESSAMPYLLDKDDQYLWRVI